MAETIAQRIDLAPRGRKSRAWAAGTLMLMNLAGAVPGTAAAPGGSIEGRVVPQHDHDFVLATARIPDLALRVDVAADGRFRFDAVRPGTYAVEVLVPSLGSAVEVVTVRPGETTSVEVELEAGSHFEEIVVTASANARNPLDLATPTTSLSGQELALRQSSSLGETLSGEPGISSTFFGPGASRPVIRGLAGDRVRMLEGGIGTGDASGTSADHAVTVDPAQAERIEVLRGPATLLYGSSAIGGVVNVLDERIPTSRAHAGVTGSAELRAGSGSDARQGSIALGGGGGDWAWHVDGVARSTDDYSIPGAARRAGAGSGSEPGVREESGFVPNTDLDTRGVRLGGSYFLGDKGFLGVAISSFESDYGLPAGAEPGGPDDDEAVPVRIDMQQRRIDLRADITRAFGIFQALRVRLGNTDYEHVELEGGEAGTHFFNDFLESRIELVQKQRGKHSGSLGVQVIDRDLDVVGAEAFLPRTSTGRWAVFSLQEIEHGPLRWQLGARFETQDIDATGFAGRSHEGASGSLGLVWSINDRWSLASSLSRSVKLPAPEELFSSGLHVASQAFEIGDPDLGEETSRGLDLSMRKVAGRLTGELTLFRQDFDGFIFQAFTGAREEGFPVVRYSQQDAVFSGIELQARYEILDHGQHHVHLRLVGDTVRAELAAGGDLPRIPPLRLGAGVHYHSERWNASAEVSWVDRQDEVAENETPTGGYTQVGASLGYRWLLRDQIVDLLLLGRNLTDQEARLHTSFLKDVAPLPGRDISLAVKVQF